MMNKQLTLKTQLPSVGSHNPKHCRWNGYIYLSLFIQGLFTVDDQVGDQYWKIFACVHAQDNGTLQIAYLFVFVEIIGWLLS